VEHDGATGVHHMCLEQDFVDVAVIVDYVKFGRRQMESPVAEILVNYVDRMVLKGRVQPGAFKHFAEDTNGIDEVGEGAENGKRGEER
jgi:hypothetical protein